MTTEEFSNEFDVLYNNISNNAGPGVNEYEKSVFLTKAQSEIVKAYFNNTTNKSRAGFDASEKRQYDFSNLLRTASLYNVNSVKERITTLEKTDRRSKVFLFPEDYFLSVNEIVTDNNQFYSVIPISYIEYQKMMTKPYPYPPKRILWRLITDKKNCNYVQDYFGDKADFKFLTTWADQKRTLSINIKNTHSNNVMSIFNVDNTSIQFQSSTINRPVKLIAGGSWADDSSNYNVIIEVQHPGDSSDMDDETVVKVIKEGFNLLISTIDTSTDKPYIEGNDKIAKVARKVDCFNLCEAPSEYTMFNSEGYTIDTKVIQLPLAELIGKTGDNLQYQMRYVRKPRPIILRDLATEFGDNVSIDGVYTKSECELASELHQEILQRAVELAKAAADGTLATAVAVGSTSSTNIGIAPTSKNSEQ